jgi:polysaccharide biosynthesis/export protein
LLYFNKQKPTSEVYKAGKNYEYKLQKGDIVSINISSLTADKYNFLSNTSNTSSQDPLLSGYLITKDGEIELSVVGKIKIENLTIADAQDTIKNRIREYLESPIVILKLLNFNLTILGEVNSPGRYSTLSNKINVMEGLGLAKDITDFGDRENILLLRQENENIKKFTINLKSINTIEEDYFYLKPNDIIIVSPLRSKALTVYQIRGITIAASIITAVSLLIYRFR